MSADLHPATGKLTVFVYDGYDGGAGFAEKRSSSSDSSTPLRRATAVATSRGTERARAAA